MLNKTKEIYKFPVTSFKTTPETVDSVLMFSGREFQVLQAKYLKDRAEWPDIYA